MTATLTPGLDARVSAETSNGEPFSEAQMNAIDRAVVRVYQTSRAVLPPVLLSERRGDPAAALRSVAYEYACEHPGDVHSRTPGEVFHHVRTRLQQHVTREVAKRRERPYGIGAGFGDAVAHAQTTQATPKPRPDGQWCSIARPVARPQPFKYKGESSRLRGEREAEALDHLGTIPGPDQWPFVIRGRVKGKPGDDRGRYVWNGSQYVYTVPDRFVWEDRELFARLHTRLPSRMEFWEQVCDEWDRKAFRRQIAEAFSAGICACADCDTALLDHKA